MNTETTKQDTEKNQQSQQTQPSTQQSSQNTKQNQKNQIDTKSIPKKPFKSVKDIGFVEEMNIRYRRTMEDGHCIYDGFRGKDEGFFSIYDGHGGRTAVEFVEKTFHTNFEKALETEKTVKDAFVAAYKKTDKQLAEMDVLYNGTTAITCYIRNEKTKDGKTVKKLYTANAGDARVVISRGGKAHRLTYDHKASDPGEAKRITDGGGFVAYNRVNGILSVTRALGDHAMKEWVVCDPYYTEIALTPKDEFVILACDGVWDVLSDQDAVDLVKDLDDAQKMADLLLKKSLEKGSTDNVSVLVIVF